MEKPQDKGILKDVTIGLLPPNVQARKSGKEACNQVLTYLSFWLFMLFGYIIFDRH